MIYDEAFLRLREIFAKKTYFFYPGKKHVRKRRASFIDIDGIKYCLLNHFASLVRQMRPNSMLEFNLNDILSRTKFPLTFCRILSGEFGLDNQPTRAQLFCHSLRNQKNKY